MQQYLDAGKFTTLPYALWGQDGHPPLWSTKNREGLKQWPLTPGVAVDFNKLGIAPAVGSPEWRKRTPVCLFAQDALNPKTWTCCCSARCQKVQTGGKAPAAPAEPAAAQT